MAKAGQRLKVLWLRSMETPCDFLLDVLTRHVDLASTRNLKEMRERLARDYFDAFFCDWTFRGGSWREALQEVQQRCPEMPAIVVCRLGGEAEWIEVLEAGAFDLLCAPYSDCTVLALLEHAAASREARNSRVA